MSSLFQPTQLTFGLRRFKWTLLEKALPDLREAIPYTPIPRPLLVVGMIGMIHPNGDEFHPMVLCHWDEIHPNGWRLLAPLG